MNVDNNENENKDKLNELSISEKIALVENLCVIHPTMQTVLDKIVYCRDHSFRASESLGMLITGESGSGKTTIINRFIEKNSGKRTKNSTIIRVVSIRVPVPATVGGLTTCLLTALGDPFPERGSIMVRTLRIYNLMKKCQVEVILFDEFQHFLERESFKLLRTVSDWTKNFMGETKLPIIFFGTPKSKEILDGEENEQLKRRFPFRVCLSAFGWKDKSERIHFRKFLLTLDEDLPLPELSGLAHPEIAYPIYLATKGRMHEIMRLIRGAAVYALERDLLKIDRDLLCKSFDFYLSANSKLRKNPFAQ